MALPKQDKFAQQLLQIKLPTSKPSVSHKSNNSKLLSLQQGWDISKVACGSHSSPTMSAMVCSFSFQVVVNHKIYWQICVVERWLCHGVY